MTKAWLDFQYTINIVNQHMKALQIEHLHVVGYIFWYIQIYPSFGLFLGDGEDTQLQGFFWCRLHIWFKWPNLRNILHFPRWFYTHLMVLLEAKFSFMIIMWIWVLIVSKLLLWSCMDSSTIAWIMTRHECPHNNHVWQSKCH
jgi:hypothetical protein